MEIRFIQIQQLEMIIWRWTIKSDAAFPTPTAWENLFESRHALSWRLCTSSDRIALCLVRVYTVKAKAFYEPVRYLI